MLWFKANVYRQIQFNRYFVWMWPNTMIVGCSSIVRNNRSNWIHAVPSFDWKSSEIVRMCSFSINTAIRTHSIFVVAASRTGGEWFIATRGWGTENKWFKVPKIALAPALLPVRHLTINHFIRWIAMTAQTADLKRTLGFRRFLLIAVYNVSSRVKRDNTIKVFSSEIW